MARGGRNFGRTGGRLNKRRTDRRASGLQGPLGDWGKSWRGQPDEAGQSQLVVIQLGGTAAPPGKRGGSLKQAHVLLGLIGAQDDFVTALRPADFEGLACLGHVSMVREHG
jgi:hypothetical protein